MITDTEIKLKGIHLLSEYLGDVEAERFITLIQREPFDYTKWRQGSTRDGVYTPLQRLATIATFPKSSNVSDGATCPVRLVFLFACIALRHKA